MSGSNVASVFVSTLNVINSALVEHGDSMPYKGLIAATEKALGGRRIGVAVYDSDSDSPSDYFTVRFERGLFQLISHGKREPDLVWKVSRDYLERVAESPDEYVQHPLKLDWEWLKSRVGLAD